MNYIQIVKEYNLLGGVSPVIDDAVKPQSLDGAGNGVNFVTWQQPYVLTAYPDKEHLQLLNEKKL